MVSQSVISVRYPERDRERTGAVKAQGICAVLVLVQGKAVLCRWEIERVPDYLWWEV